MCTISTLVQVLLSGRTVNQAQQWSQVWQASGILLLCSDTTTIISGKKKKKKKLKLRSPACSRLAFPSLHGTRFDFAEPICKVVLAASGKGNHGSNC